MTTLTRWEPFREVPTMREAMERFFEEPLFEPMRFWTRPLDEFRPAIDVAEEDGAYIVKASVPGVKPEEIEITLSDNMLTIKGESKADKEIKEENYHMRERRYGSFMRCMTLPTAVDSNKVEATHENGVLTLRLPKSEEAKPKKIAVKTMIEAKKK
ncbi:MAG: Hsp20/alpha crystallin family protein [Caldilineaceae bacterium]